MIRALHTDPYFYDAHVSVSIENGAVVLRGFVFSEWDLHNAVRIATKAAGDRQVINSLHQRGRTPINKGSEYRDESEVVLRHSLSIEAAWMNAVGNQRRWVVLNRSKAPCKMRVGNANSAIGLPQTRKKAFAAQFCAPIHLKDFICVNGSWCQ